MLRNTFFIIAVTVFLANTQTINLQGVVSNSDGDPISGALVSLVRQNMKDTTGADGKFSFIDATSVKDLPAIVPQANDISLKNNVLQLALRTQSSMRVELFDLQGNLVAREVTMNAAAGIYRFDIAKHCRTANVLVIKAAIGRSEVSFRYMALNGVKNISTPLTAGSAISGGSGLTAMAAVVDTLTVEATGYQTKSVAITSLDNQEQNITLEAEVAG